MHFDTVISYSVSLKQFIKQPSKDKGRKKAICHHTAGAFVRVFFPDPVPVPAAFFLLECTFTGSGVGVEGWLPSSITLYCGNEFIDEDRPEDIHAGAGLAVLEMMDPG